MDSGFAAQDDDEQLIRRFRISRDRSIFAELYRRHHHGIFHSCRNVVRNNSAAEDLTHDTFVVAYKNIDRYVEGRFSGWLRTIAIHQAINWLRSPGEPANI